MKHSLLSRVLLVPVFVCAISASAIAQPAGRLIVERMPNFGWNLGFHLQIDDTPVGSIVQGRRFDGWLPAGRHVLTVYKVPYIGFAQPISTTVNIQPGSTYIFRAMWDSNFVYLRPVDVLLSPGELWQLRGDIY